MVDTDLINAWKEETDSLAGLFHDRKSQAVVEPMKNFIDQFLRALYQLNQFDGLSVDGNHEELEELKHKPINIVERIEYIEQNVTRYNAYIQLNTLYKELEKLVAKVEILEQMKKD